MMDDGVSSRPINYDRRRLSSTIDDEDARRPSSNIGMGDFDQETSGVAPESRAAKGYYANVFVQNEDGGEIVTNDPALADWSVDAMLLIRNQLYRASNGLVRIPGEANWTTEESINSETAGQLIYESDTPEDDEVHPKDEGSPRTLPDWATRDTNGDTAISDLPLMATEVSELLGIMEEVMAIQRHRRLDKVQPTGFLRRNWYMAALGIPCATWVLYRLGQNGYGVRVLRYTFSKLRHFLLHHIRDPLVAM